MFEQDEDEFWRLQTGISTVEALLANRGIAGNTGVKSMLVTFIENAKQRVNVLEREGLFAPEDEKKKKAMQETALVQYLVEKETALSAGEREQYGAFLSREYFTRSDFNSLEGFYANTWDKLTETGKAQMSHRVWEGVRRDEYVFSELPETVKEKESARIREMLADTKRMPPELNRIPENDRSDFTRAWDAGKREQSYEVLNRPSFAENVALGSRVIDENAAARSPNLDTTAVKEAEKETSKPAETAQAFGTMDLTKLDMQLGTAESKSVSPARLSEPKSITKIDGRD